MASLRSLLSLLWAVLLSSFPFPFVSSLRICTVGAGIGGAALVHFLETEHQLTAQGRHELVVLEKDERVGGRMSLADVDGELFEAGASIIHEKNAHMVQFARELGLGSKVLTGQGLGIWDGDRFLMTQVDENSWLWPLALLRNLLVMAWRYGIWRLQTLSHFTQQMFSKWMLMYEEGLPPFQRPEALLAGVGLLPLTQATLEDTLQAQGLRGRIAEELATAVIRIQYGQNLSITALPGLVGLFGTGSSLWQVPGGNYRVAEGLLQRSRVDLLLNHTVTAVVGEAKEQYILLLSSGKNISCGVVVLAAPLAVSGIELRVPDVVLPTLRPYHHTHVTFVRGVLNESYFGQRTGSTLPGLIATVENDRIPFSSISLQSLKPPQDPVYKVFSRQQLSDDVIKLLFRRFGTIVRFDWEAYPSYSPPESFPAFLLDDHHLYYLNTFEGAASAMEAAAVAARNVARLIHERLARVKDQGVQAEAEGVLFASRPQGVGTLKEL